MSEAKRCGVCGSMLELNRLWMRPDSWVCVKAGCPAWRYNGEPNAAPKASEAPVESERHGISCPKVGHGPALRGYLHAADDDSPYEVDGVWYCGRCHTWIANRECSEAQGYPRLSKPAPAPEPKQGSEEPIEPVTELEAEKSTSKILRNLLVKAEAERDEARATKDMHKERQEEAWAERDALRAEVERLKEAISGSNGEGRAILTVNVIRHWSDESKAALVEKISDYSALRADLAAAQVEIKSLKFEKEAFREAHAEKARALADAREEIAKLRKFVSEAMHEADAEKARADRAEERVKELEDQDLQVLETDDTSIDLIGFWRNARARARAILAARARKEGGSNA